MNVGAVVGEYFLFSWESHPNKQSNLVQKPIQKWINDLNFKSKNTENFRRKQGIHFKILV